MSYRLFLDDQRKPPQTTHEWVVAKSLAEFKRVILARGLPEFVGFDHDLTEAHYAHNYRDGLTGLDAVMWLHGFCVTAGKPFPNYATHTLNRGREQVMLNFLCQTWPEQYHPAMYHE